MASAEKRTDSLVRELTRVSGRRFDKLDENRGSYRPLTGIEELTALAAEFTEDQDGLRRWQRIEKLIQAAVDEIADSKQQQRVKLLFGLHPGLASLTARELLKNLREELKSDRDVAAKTTYTRNQQALGGLAKAIRVLTAKYRIKNRHGPYVRREMYHQQLEAALSSAFQVIELVGLPGMGKTSLAVAVTRQYLPKDQTLLIRFESDELPFGSLWSALNSLNIAVSEEDLRRNPEAYFAEILCGPRAPKIVILDGLTSADPVYDHLPDEIKPTVIITAHVPSDRPHDSRAVIMVGQMDDVESTTLIKNLVSDISDGDCEILVKTLCGYPILISRACTLLTKWDAPVRGFSESVKRDAASLASSVKTKEGQRLTVVLQRLIELVREESYLAYEILECLSFLDGYPSVELHFINLYLGVGREGGLMGLTYIQALDALHRFSFIEPVANAISGKPELETHSLIKKVARSLLHSSEEKVLAQAGRVVDFCFTEINSWEASEKVASGMFEAKLRSMWEEDAGTTSLSVGEQYRRFQHARFFFNFIRGQLAIFRQAKKLHEHLIAHPGERFGTAAFVYRNPDVGFEMTYFPPGDEAEGGE